MKRTILLFPIILFALSASVQALSWAYPFVVWDGSVYEVLEEKVPERQIGKSIGKVETIPDDMTGDHYGNASNAYPIGTKYFKIKGLSTDRSIAVVIAEKEWQKAVYVHEAPFHWRDVVPYIIPVLVVIVIGIFAVFYLKKRK
jgi:hypothetical protein